MPIAIFSRNALPAGFATRARFYKIDRRGGTVVLIDMTCPHRGGPLTHGACDGQRVVCPWHHGRISRHKLEQCTQPAITTSDRVLLIVDSAPMRVFREIPVDGHWSETT